MQDDAPRRLPDMPEISKGVFARAKGPRREVGGDFDLPCPWCGCNNGDLTADQNDDGSSTCVECGKEFVCPDEKGDLVCVGLLSPADMKYLAAKEAEGHDQG